MAVDHLCMQWLTHCYRGQAPSHIWISIDQIDLALLLICSCSCPSISEVPSVGARAEPPAAATEETDMYPTPENHQPACRKCSIAQTAASTRDRNPNLCSRFFTCTFTVPSVIPNLCPITLLL